MFRTVVTLSVLALATVGCSGSSTHSESVSVKSEDIGFTIERPRAGTDFPTDSNMGAAFADKKIIVLTRSTRIAVLKSMDVSSSIERERKSLTMKLSLAQSKAELVIEKAVAGIDYPQLSPPAPGVPAPLIITDFLVFTDAVGKRHSLARVKAIVKAEAGVDYPDVIVMPGQQGPDLNKDFLVAIAYTDQGKVRIALPAKPVSGPQPSGASVGNQ